MRVHVQQDVRLRSILLRILVYGGIVAAMALCLWYFMFRMPGDSWSGPLPALTEREVKLAEALERDVTVLAEEIGDRNVPFQYEGLTRAADFIEEALRAAGYAVERQTFFVRERKVANLIAELPGSHTPGEIVVVGAHYDSATGCPAANDNGTGVAGVLALARAFADERQDRTLRFVLFVNEEPPYFQTDEMGSLVYARRCREREENITAMLSLETMGCYSDEKGSQKYPFPVGLFYPSTGNFIGFVGNYGSRRLVRRAIGVFREHARFPSEGGALPGWVPGVGYSDHWSFWQAGYDGIMVTDTAPFRYPHYHRSTDTPDKVDFDRLARVVAGLEHVVRDLSTVEAAE